MAAIPRTSGCPLGVCLRGMINPHIPFQECIQVRLPVPDQPANFEVRETIPADAAPDLKGARLDSEVGRSLFSGE